jgi:apolipoprotein N-acyltransferase
VLRTAIKLWPWLAAIATGLLGVFCFAPFDQNWISWIALIPLTAAVWFSGGNSKRRWLRNVLLGYLAGIVFFTGVFSWLGSLGVLYQSVFLHGLSFLLSIYLGVHFGFWAWFIGLIRPKAFTASWSNLLVAFLGAAAWATHEWIRGWLFTGFGWNGLGVALHQNWPLIQISEFTGVAGVSFALVFVNIILVTVPLRFFAEARTHRMRPHFDLTLTMIGMVALFAFGLRRAENSEPTKPLRVAAVQADVPQLEKFDPEFTRRIFDKFARLSEIGLGGDSPPDLLIWPESSMPDPVRDEGSASNQFVKQFSASAKVDLLVGSLELGNDKDYNTAVLISKGGDRTQVYRKIHLVPFGEYIPLRHAFPVFAAVANTWVPGDFTAGTEYTVFDLTNNAARVAPLICFEDTVADLARRFVLNGANLFVDITNDGWFLRSSGSQQHLANAIFRCVENRRPMVRAANTGVTSFINEFGRVTQILRDDTGNTFTEGVLTGDVNVPANGPVTFFARHGELFAESCAVITGAAILFRLFTRKRL